MRVHRQIRIGGSTKVELLQRLAQNGVSINESGRQLFEDERFQTLASVSVVETVQATVRELGLAVGGTFPEILEAATIAGLSVCPLELGPHLRLVFFEQTEGSVGLPQTKHRAPPGSITVASAPLNEDDETPKGFYLRRIEGVLWLRGYTSWSGHLWPPEDGLVFAQAPNAS